MRHPGDPILALDLRPRRSWRTVKSWLMSAAMFGAFVLISLPLLAILYALFSKGAAIAFKSFPDFFTKEIPIVSRRHGPGMGPAILGTLLVTGTATLIAVPLGILGAVYLHEYGVKSKFARLVRFMAMVMTGVPSIVMGLFIYVIFTLQFGLEGFGGALALACLMLPVVINTSEQMLKLVPNALREASYALGASKARTIVTVVLPAAAPGIVSGSLLAVARAAGETAPLMFTIGAATEINTSLFHEETTALSKQIFANANEAVVNAQDRGWGAALTLVLLAFALTLVARTITAFATRKK